MRKERRKDLSETQIFISFRVLVMNDRTILGPGLWITRVYLILFCASFNNYFFGWTSCRYSRTTLMLGWLAGFGFFFFKSLYENVHLFLWRSSFPSQLYVSSIFTFLQCGYVNPWATWGQELCSVHLCIPHA